MLTLQCSITLHHIHTYVECPFLLVLSSMKRRVVRQLILLQKRTMERISVQDTPAVGEAASEKKSLLGGATASEDIAM